MQETTWGVRVASAGETATVFARRAQFPIGRPLSFDLQEPHPTALEHLLGAVGADLVNGLQEVARKRRLQVDQVEAQVDCRLQNPLTYLGVVGEEGHPGVESLAARVFVSSLDPAERVHAAWEETLRRSPLVNTLKSSVRLDLSLKVVL